MPQPPRVDALHPRGEDPRHCHWDVGRLTAPFALAAGLINTSKTTPLKLSTIFSPPNRPEPSRLGLTGRSPRGVFGLT